jgi:Iap family predicted aminopeptidase
MNAKIVMQRLESLPESLQLMVFDYIEFLSSKYTKIKEYEKSEEFLPKEIKNLLEERLEKYHKNPEKVKSWEDIEQRLLKKHNYEI